MGKLVVFSMSFYKKPGTNEGTVIMEPNPF